MAGKVELSALRINNNTRYLTSQRKEMCALGWDMESEINAKNDGMGVTTPVHKGPHDLLNPTLRKHGYLHRQNTTVAHWGILSSGGSRGKYELSPEPCFTQV